VTGSSAACVGSTTVTVTVDTPPMISTSAIPAAICNGGSSVISATGAANYTWNPGNMTGSSVIVSPGATKVYTVTGFAGACSVQSTVVVTILPTPTVIASYSGNVCEGDPISLFANGSSGYKFVWTGPAQFFSTQQNPVILNTHSGPGIYHVSLTDSSGFGCGASSAVTVSVYPKPVADFNYSPYEPLDGEQVNFTDASYSNIVSWNWYFTNTAQYTSTLQNPVFTFPDHGSYVTVLAVTNSQGCRDTVSKLVLVKEDYAFYIPNTFTPNNDGLNDIFQPKGTGVVKYEMSIFDRWGEKLFYTDEFQKGWDGSFHGKICPNDVYVYLVRLTNIFGKSFELTGHVSLVK
jgi:gliding motility-associated-like protein